MQKQLQVVHGIDHLANYISADRTIVFLYFNIQGVWKTLTDSFFNTFIKQKQYIYIYIYIKGIPFQIIM